MLTISGKQIIIMHIVKLDLSKTSYNYYELDIRNYAMQDSNTNLFTLVLHCTFNAYVPLKIALIYVMATFV